MKKDIEWRHLRGLNELYNKEYTKLKITNNKYINQVLFKQKKLIRFRLGNHSIIETTDRYKVFYEKEFLDTYSYYNDFFEKSNLENNGHKRFKEEDIKVLMFVFYNKEELKNKLTTEYTFSNRVFKGKGAKYLASKPSLRDAVLFLLDIKEFPEKDPKNNQWRIIVDCLNPKLIVLCENISCLKVPTEYKKNNIELWYVGGNNTKPLNDLPLEKLKLPIYYFCDWDFHGLDIYYRIKKIFKSKNKEIEILEPINLENSLPVNSPNHKSKWKEKIYSIIKDEVFTDSQITLIKTLINQDEWVEEESMDLIEILEKIKVIKK